ncbi:hypothetical protein ACWM35_13735 [Neobacillus sp. K501]
MNFDNNIIDAVSNGKRLNEVKALPPVAKIHLALAIGLESDKDTFDDEEIAKFITDRNKNIQKVTEK